MGLYNPTKRADRIAQTCSDDKTPCGPSDCGPIPGNDLECCPTRWPHRDVCPVNIYMPDCEPSLEVPLNGKANCDCIPCLDEVAFTDEQKSAVTQILTGLLSNISPYSYNCCQIVDPTGHHYPLTPAPALDPETGERLYIEQLCPGATFEWAGYTVKARKSDVTCMTEPLIITQSEYDALSDEDKCDYKQLFDTCCDVPEHSAFVSQGMSPYGALGISGVGIAPVGDLSSIEGHEMLGKLFCCALDKLFAAPSLVLEDDPE